jgi:AraC family transcriptional regulator, regulatory protein of adaptative response / methylated-DNA-[protein]-cysteine methyltransferase
MNALATSPPTRITFSRYASDEQKWAAVQRHDPKADDVFVFAVKTTGVYCRPSCPSRPPRRANVAFYASCSEAERASFRPCKRCQPNGPGLAANHAAMVAKACRILETREPAPDLETLARAVGMSVAHFHRVFTKIAGVSPKAYARAHRAASLRHNLRQSARVTEAIYAAGYPSSGRFYAEAAQTLGMKPKIFLRGGRGETIRFATGKSSLGTVLVAATAKGVCAIFLGGDPKKLARDLRERFPKANLVEGDRDFEQTIAAAIALVENPHARADLPLDIRGTLFQQKVWRALTEIPLGKTSSYARVARRIGQPGAARAVASACAANKIAVAIPCHRVVRTDGSLSGYRWGVERKRALLARESAREQIQG